MWMGPEYVESAADQLVKGLLCMVMCRALLMAAAWPHFVIVTAGVAPVHDASPSRIMFTPQLLSNSS